MGILGQAASYVLFSILHFVQFIMAVAVIGLYATDLSRARKENKYIDSKWVCMAASLGGRTAGRKNSH